MMTTRFRCPSYVLAGACLLYACAGERISLGAGAAAHDASAPVEGPFAAVQLLALESPDGAKDDDPTLTSDLMLLVFNSTRDGGSGREDMWFAERSAPSEPFSAPKAVVELNSEQRETGLALAPDGLTLWFSSDRPGGAGGLDVYTARRARRSDRWSAPTRVVELSSHGDDLISCVTRDGRTALLARRDDEDQDYNLFSAQRDHSDMSWPAPRALESLNSDGAESDAFLSEDQLSLVFTRDEQLLLAQRGTRAKAFAVARDLSEVNSADEERDAWLSADLRTIVFASDRSGRSRLYWATVP